MSSSRDEGEAPRPGVWDRMWRGGPFGVDVTSRAIAEMLFGHGVVRGKSVLELGCGNGRLSWLALEWGASEVTLVDFSPEALRAARVLFGDDPRATFVAADLLTWNPPRLYDFVFSSGLLEHFRGEDFVRAIRAHVGASGEHVGIVVPTWPHPNSLRCRIPSVERKYGWQRPLRLSEFRRVLEDAGAEVEQGRRFLPFYGIPWLSASAALRRASRFADAWCGGLLAVQARRRPA